MGEQVEVELSQEQLNALAVLESGRNVFLTGEAGTGKSTVLRAFRKRKEGTCLVLAPTGVAAVNVGGATIHSQFLLKPGMLGPERLEPMNDDRRRQVIRAAHTIIVDEISMVRSDLFVSLDCRLRELAYGPNKERPFGGKQIVAVGDFMQLPPVVNGDVEWSACMRFGGVYAFQTDLWIASEFVSVCLKEVHRQASDGVFQSVLNNLRHGTVETAGRILNARCLLRKKLPSTPVCLCTTNGEADAINRSERLRLNGVSRAYEARVSGHFPPADCPADPLVEVAEGARVMLLCNHRNEKGEFDFVNGDMGIVIGFGEDESVPEVHVRLDKGVEVTVGYNDWKKYVYATSLDAETGKPVVVEQVLGMISQMPLRLAYAITIHKAQGLSLDSVDLRLGAGCFAHGQLYTALSRCRTLDGLRLDRPVTEKDLIIDQAVRDFYAQMSSNVKLPNESFAAPPYYEEAMRYYLNAIAPAKADCGSRQFEFDFSSHVYSHPIIDRMLSLWRAGHFNKYDAPVIRALAEACIDGQGLTDEQFKTAARIIERYSAIG